jgi:hypothetical protein
VLGNVMWLALPLVLMCCQGQEQARPQPVYFEQPAVEAPNEPVVKPTPRPQPQVKELGKGLGEAQELLKGMRDR